MKLFNSLKTITQKLITLYTSGTTVSHIAIIATSVVTLSAATAASVMIISNVTSADEIVTTKAEVSTSELPETETSTSAMIVQIETTTEETTTEETTAAPETIPVEELNIGDMEEGNREEESVDKDELQQIFEPETEPETEATPPAALVPPM